MTRYQLIAPTLIAAILMIVWAGCPGPSTPTITLTATDCPKDQIGISASKTVGGSASNWNVRVDVTITCNGEPLGGAELKFTPWIGDAIKLTTGTEGDNLGKARYTKRVSTTERPGDLTVNVEVEGSDGTKTESVTV